MDGLKNRFGFFRKKAKTTKGLHIYIIFICFKILLFLVKTLADNSSPKISRKSIDVKRKDKTENTPVKKRLKQDLTEKLQFSSSDESLTKTSISSKFGSCRNSLKKAKTTNSPMHLKKSTKVDELKSLPTSKVISTQPKLSSGKSEVNDK